MNNDEFINEGKTIIYEGHNIDEKFNKTDYLQVC